MNTTVFMISDASFSEQTKIAGLGIIDTSSGKKYQKSTCEIKDSTEAEFLALLYSVKIAIDKRYDNVVFVYDNMGLDLKELKKYVNKKFKYAQFLWLKREYLKEADKLAKKVRQLKEKFAVDLIKEHPLKIPEQDKGNKLKDKQLLEYFKTFSVKQIVFACSYCGNEREKEVLQGYALNKKVDIYDKNGVITLGSKKRNLMKRVYDILPKEERKQFYQYLSYLDLNIQPQTFGRNFSVKDKSIFIKKVLGEVERVKYEN